MSHGWGSTAGEQDKPLVGDEEVSRPSEQTTHAITIRRPPEEVWPWLVQMGYGRAGWYTPAWVDQLWRVRNPSADRIHPEFQELSVGDQILDGPPGTATFRVLRVDPAHALVLHSQRHPTTGRPPDPTKSNPGPYLDFTWAFVLEPAVEGTRLLLRTRSNSQPAWMRVIARFALRPADIVMGRWMLKGIRRRVEAGSLHRNKVHRARRATLDAAAITRSNATWGLFECDVTKSRELISGGAASTGRRISFSAFLTHAIARAIHECPPANSVRDLRDRIVTFDEVDALVMIETEIDGALVAVGRVMRAANYKTVEAIHIEIRGAQGDPLAGDAGKFLRAARWTPGWLRKATVRMIDRSPILAKRYKGTVSISAIGMFAEASGWGIAPLHHTVSVTVGGIAVRPDPQAGERQYLSVTLGIDHDMLDGAPAARLAQRIQHHIENATGLEFLSETNN